MCIRDRYYEGAANWIPLKEIPGVQNSVNLPPVINEEDIELAEMDAGLEEYLNEKEISEDDLKKGEALIQDITDQHVEKVDSLLKEKEKDLLDF